MLTHAPALTAYPLDPHAAPETLAGWLATGPVAIAFFKISCPVCQLAFPFLDRIARRGGGGLRIVGISQDEAGLTARFAERFGVGFWLGMDRAAGGYPASNAYGLTHVPSIFVVEPDGAISRQWSGFSKVEMEKLAARAGGEGAPPLFGPGDAVPEWKAG